jgi:enamine deaminase RidA (YjgF/YER057c/UK114 family)
MALVEDEHVVQAFSAQRSHPALGDRLWRPERSADLGDAEGPHPSVEDRTTAPVTIVDEKARWLPIPAAALDDLPACPFGRRMPRRLDVENFPVGVTNNEEHIKRLKEDRPHAEEVAGPIAGACCLRNARQIARISSSIDAAGRVVHPNDVLRRLDRALAKVDALLHAGRASLGDMMYLTVYLRDPADFARIKSYLSDRFAELPVIVVHGTVCRPEWLIEVEGVAVVANQSPQLPAF